MLEANVVERVDEPGIADSLAADLRALGVERDDTLLIHLSLSSLGRAAGGPQAVVDALRTVLTDDGTLVMSTHTGQYTDPSVWENLPAPDDWVEIIGESIPPFRLGVTPTRGIGTVSECSRNYPGIVRSERPMVSFVVWGAAVEETVGGHEPDYGFGDGSPLARMYDRDGDMLLLGVGHGNNTSLHLAEHRADFEKMRMRGRAPLLRGGERVVVGYDDIEVKTGNFEVAGEAFEGQRGAAEGPAAAVTATLLDQPVLVDFAEDWLESNR